MQISTQALQAALARIQPGWQLLEARQLSARAAILQLRLQQDAPQRLMLLWHSARDRGRNPDIARQEYALLRSLSEAGLAAPRPLLVDASAALPFLITEFVAGEMRFAAADLPAFCDRLAGILCQIHSLRIAQDILPASGQMLAADLREMTPEVFGIRAALRATAPHIACNTATLLHGDFWLGNLLWRGERLAAIIDWEDAMVGDPLADLGKSRLEMLWALGEEALDRYTAAYQARNVQLDYSALAFWDLWGALRLAHFEKWSAAQKIPRMRAQYQRFIAAALAKLE